MTPRSSRGTHRPANGVEVMAAPNPRSDDSQAQLPARADGYLTVHRGDGTGLARRARVVPTW